MLCSTQKVGCCFKGGVCSYRWDSKWGRSFILKLTIIWGIPNEKMQKNECHCYSASDLQTNFCVHVGAVMPLNAFYFPTWHTNVMNRLHLRKVLWYKQIYIMQSLVAFHTLVRLQFSVLWVFYNVGAWKDWDHHTVICANFGVGLYIPMTRLLIQHRDDKVHCHLSSSYTLTFFSQKSKPDWLPCPSFSV